MTTNSFPRRSLHSFNVLVLICLLTLSLGSVTGMNVQAESLYLVIATIPVGAGPNGVAVNENTNRIYVTNYADNCINRSKPHSKIGHVAHRDRSMPHS